MKWIFIVLLVLVVLNFTHRIYLNIFTHSLPYGIYMRINGVPQRDDFAATCLTPEIAQYGVNRGYLAQGNCDTGSVLVLKRIKGLPGDHFVVRDGFLELNGYNYLIMSQDSVGRKLGLFYHQNVGLVALGKYFLLSDFAKNSWDSRYWGPVGIQFLLKPLWLFEKYK